MTDRETSDDELAADLAELDRVRARAEARIDAIPDPHRAFTQATRFADALRDAVGSAARLRARAAARIYEAEKLTLGELAKRVGVSKSRAGQFVDTARDPQGGERDADG